MSDKPDAETTVLPSPSTVTSSSRQFAGALLSGRRDHERPFVTMFTMAAGSTPVLPIIKLAAVALRELNNSPVAVICLSESFRPSDFGKHSALTEDFGEWQSAEIDGITLVSRHMQRKPVVTVEEFASVLDRLRPKHELICVDAGAAISSVQGIMLASSCSGVVILIEAGVTTSRDLEQAQASLAQANARLLGCAFINGK